MGFLFPVNPTEENLVDIQFDCLRIKTMERYYENMRFRQLTSGIVDVKRKEIANGDYKNFNIDSL